MDRKNNKAPEYDNYKTQMCKNWIKNKKCPYSNCTYAHGNKELNHYLYGEPLNSSGSEDDDEEEEKVSSEKSSQEEVIPPPKITKYVKPAPKKEPVNMNTIFSNYPEDTKLKML